MMTIQGVDLKSFLSSNIPRVGASTLETKVRAQSLCRKDGLLQDGYYDCKKKNNKRQQKTL